VGRPSGAARFLLYDGTEACRGPEHRAHPGGGVALRCRRHSPHPATDQFVGRRRGRRTSSPLQFGQVADIASVHAGQKVHSKLQIQASALGGSGVEQRSQLSRISSAMRFSSLRVSPRVPQQSARQCGSVSCTQLAENLDGWGHRVLSALPNTPGSVHPPILYQRSPLVGRKLLGLDGGRDVFNGVSGVRGKSSRRGNSRLHSGMPIEIAALSGTLLQERVIVLDNSKPPLPRNV
jgi:hypothetical protein